MRYPLLIMLACCTAVRAGASPSIDDREGRPCVECHAAIVESFSRTRMAKAAIGDDFLAERREKARPPQCLRCHAPSGGAGIVCADCHGRGNHPYAKLTTPAVCERCHDAPGENTVRSYRKSRAVNRAEGCLDCHLTDNTQKTDHHFKGPTTPEFLEGIARLRVFFRKADHNHVVMVIQIHHKAGHALPGGTTGRSVWLIVSGLDSNGEQVWRQTMRFGWEHRPDGVWRDRTLPSDRPQVLEIAEAERHGAQQIKAELWYRFRPGAITKPDPRAVRLDAIKQSLP